MSSTTPAGWYPDPEREGATRWWDGTQWAPSQDPAASDDRFKPRDDADAGAAGADAASTGAEPSWSPEPYAGPGTAWDGTPAQDAGAQAEPSWSPTPASTPQPTASAPSWQQQDTPSWQQQSAPAWGQQAATPQYGAPQDFSQSAGTQQWNSYGTPPKKRRTGLFVGIGVGVVVLLLLLVGGGIWGISTFLSNANQQTQTQGGGTGGGGTGGGGTTNGGDLEIGQTYRISVPVDQTIQLQLVLPESGFYSISANTANDEDPVLTLISSTGEEWSDDDGGGYPNSLLEENLDAGTYTLIVEEYGNNSALEVDVTVNRG